MVLQAMTIFYPNSDRLFMSNTHYNFIEPGNGVPINAWTKGVKLEDEAKALKAGNIEIWR